MTTSNVTSVTSNNLTVSNGDVLVVFDDGVTFATIVSGGGTENVSAGGVVNSTTVVGGGVETVFSGGVASGTMVIAGGNQAGNQYVSSGGHAIDTVLTGGNETLFFGGTASGTQVSSGGIMTISSGGVADLTAVNSSGVEYVLSGGSANTTTVGAAGFEILFGGTTTGTVLDADGTQEVQSAGAVASATIVNGLEYVFNGGTAIGSVISSGGFDVVETTGTVTSTIVWSGGSEFVENGGVATSTTVNSGGTEVVYAGGSASDTLVNLGGTIDVSDLTFSSGGSAFVDTNGMLTVSVGGKTYSQQLALEDAGAHFLVTADANGDLQATLTSLALCFLAGTMIATPDGETAVERLVPGDLVRTAAGVVRPVVWCGTGRALATPNRRNAATPVIVRKAAIADNVPHADLRLTKGHAFFFDGVLIPVEFLVNHRSIHWDDRAQEVTLYHIELEVHDVLLANGAPAESYRDDGNRWLFQNANSGWGQPPKPPCAPILTGGPIVDAVWRQLLLRSGPRPNLPLTDDPDLHLRVDGDRVDGTKHSSDLCVFKLNHKPDAVLIVSRAAAPQELGFARDPRCLGIALRRVVVLQANQIRTIEADDGRLSEGLHAFESDNGFRWTDGEATLPAELFAGLNGPIDVIVQYADTGHYIDYGGSQHAA